MLNFDLREIFCSQGNAMSTITSDVNGFVALAQAYAQANNNHISASEIAFFDELWFHHGQDMSLAVFLALPQQYQSIEVPAIGIALQTPDPYGHV